MLLYAAHLNPNKLAQGHAKLNKRAGFGNVFARDPGAGVQVHVRPLLSCQFEA